ncbi:MAG: ATP-binding cassette domain-containing protein, partial [Betaproteobacteria bacterium]|nr:ATP-binding cassette domain-containing protein [Betaproteobacteria bacterium]
MSEVSLDIAAGEFIVLCGHSGAGKSTLLKLVPLIERPTSGRVFVNGEDITRLRRAAVPYLRRSLGLVYQDQKLLLDRSVFDNVMLPLEICGMPHTDATRRVRAALDKVGLARHEKTLPMALSGGEQQRVAIARALVNRPAVLLADEPTAYLDAGQAGEIAAMFRSFNRVGVTVVLATHDEALFEPWCSRRVVLDHGRVAAAEAPAQAAAEGVSPHAALPPEGAPPGLGRPGA